jgi:hypothetical protein
MAAIFDTAGACKSSSIIFAHWLIKLQHTSICEHINKTDEADKTSTQVSRTGTVDFMIRLLPSWRGLK